METTTGISYVDRCVNTEGTGTGGGEWSYTPSSTYQWIPPFRFEHIVTREEILAGRFYSEHLARGGKPTSKAARRCWKASQAFYEAMSS